MNKSMHKLSNRMLMNVSLIPAGKVVADIGCDHGWVSIYLIQNKLARKVFAMDVAAGPLNGAREHITDAGLTDSIEVRMSDGVNELGIDENGRLEADIILMAGMGGQLAVRLIRDNLKKCRSAEYIILQAQSELDYVRASVYEMGFEIDDEAMIYEDGKFYTAMRLKTKGRDIITTLSEAELRYGPVLIKTRPDVFIDYLKQKRDSYISILNRIEQNSSDDSRRAMSIRKEISIIDNLCGY